MIEFMYSKESLLLGRIYKFYNLLFDLNTYKMLTLELLVNRNQVSSFSEKFSVS